MPSDWMTLDQLAEFLSRPKATILKDRVRNPDAVPPAKRLPGTRHLLWHRPTVEKWLEGLAPASPDPMRAKGPGGRPRKPL